jgi:chromosome partitioning protein
VSANQSPKTIATINFKGGVGKTTVTWYLGDVVSSLADSKVLIFDLDAQMSLTQAIALNEDTGMLNPKFQKWYEQAIDRKKTIFNALDQFTKPAAKFDFGVGWDFIYKVTENLHFVPSVQDLYWLELEVFDRDGVKEFVRRLLGKIGAAKQLPDYDYVLFDCPPSFTLLSYSVLACCDLILIPVNPDFFASRGTSLILDSLKMRIEPFPLPRIGVFMNKAKPYGGLPTKESQFYMREVKNVCNKAAKAQQIRATFFDAWIPDRAAIKRAITGGGVPFDLVDPFKNLWIETVEYLK